LATLSCPRCHQFIDSQAITCPHCRITLKAFGHPEIPLHRSISSDYLCETCVYHQDDSCNFPKRPYAQDCTLYQNLQEVQLEMEQQTHIGSWNANLKNWFKRNQGIVLVLVLLVICFFMALLTS
jgi:hypothetical protein